MFGDKFPLGMARFFLAILFIYSIIQLVWIPEWEKEDTEMIGLESSWIAYPVRCIDILGINTTGTNLTRFDNADYARREKYYIADCEMPVYSEPNSEEKTLKTI